MKGQRSQRVNSEMQKELSALIQGPLKDKEPELRGLISVTEADVAPDLKTAKIYVSVLAKNEEDKKQAFCILRCILRENAGFLRHELARVMRMRTVPELTIIEDDSMAYGARMDKLLDELNEK